MNCKQLLGVTTYYVDCDNVRFHKFIAFLSKLEKEAKDLSKIKFKLYLDSHALPTWKGIRFLQGAPKINLEIINLNRVANCKSVADVVIALDIGKQTALNPAEKIALMSSDSDFYGLIDSGVDLAILYDSEIMGQNYKKCLQDKGISNFNIHGLKLEENGSKLKEIVVAEKCLKTLINVPFSHWRINDIMQRMSKGVSIDVGHGVVASRRSIHSIVGKVLNEVEINKTKDAIKLTFRGYTLENKLRVNDTHTSRNSR